MKQIHHALFISAIIGCITAAVICSRTRPEAAPEEADDAPAQAATPVSTPVSQQQIIADEAASRERVTELARMEQETARWNLAAEKTYELRSDLRVRTRAAWNSMLLTNRSTLLALRTKVAEGHLYETPCTICDSKGDMHFCVLCRNNDGHCPACEGTGRSYTGGDCPACLGTKKCHLCHGSGKMPCLFCDDGMIPNIALEIPQEMPLNCPEPFELQATSARLEKEKSSKIDNVVSQWLETAPPVRQLIQTAQNQVVEVPTPPFWQRTSVQLLVLLLGAMVAGGTHFWLLRPPKPPAEVPAVSRKLPV